MLTGAQWHLKSLLGLFKYDIPHTQGGHFKRIPEERGCFYLFLVNILLKEEDQFLQCLPLDWIYVSLNITNTNYFFETETSLLEFPHKYTAITIT